MELKEIPINKIDVEENYRKTFNEQKLGELAQSIRKNGVIQAIVVRPHGDRYVLIAGERRLRASKLADKVTIPAQIREVDDVVEGIELQLIENTQRENVSYMEEAYGFQKFRDKGSLDVKEIAKRVGKHESYVYVQLKLVTMAEDARRIAENGWITRGVAWEISKLKREDEQIQAANDLARTKADKMITVSGATTYIASNFGDSPARLRKDRVANFGLGSDKDYAANWKHHLVRFDTDQFERFKGIVRNRTETAVLAEAVDLVMRRTEEVAA